MASNRFLSELFVMINYDDTRDSEELINYHEIYVSGAKDGVGLLKELGIVEEY